MQNISGIEPFFLGLGFKNGHFFKPGNKGPDLIKIGVLRLSSDV